MRAALTVLLLLSITGCITRPMGKLVIVSTRPLSTPVRVLAVRVPGEHCVRSFLGIGNPQPSYYKAARDAVSKIKGATTMLATSLYYYDTGPLGALTPYTHCIRVEGEVGVFE